MKVSSRHSGSVLPAALLVSGAAVLIILLILLLDRRPLVEYSGPLDRDALRQIEQLVVDNSPEQLSRDGQQRIELSTGELNLLATFLLQRLPLDREVALQIRPRTPVSRVDISLPLGGDSLRSYLNLSAGVRVEEGSPQLVSLRVGQLPIPGVMQEQLIAAMIRLAERHELREAALAELRQAVRGVEILDDGIAVDLRWQFEALARLRHQARQSLLGEDAQQRLLHYYRLAHEMSGKTGGSGSLYRWLGALFTSARDRTRQGADAVEENRSALQAMALYANGIDPRLLIADVPPTLPAGGRLPPLRQRRDLSRHLLTAAAISASAGAPVADLLANSKELHDARYGTGFSVSDTIANQAGARLGLMAVADRDAALVIQQRLADVTSDDLYMPAVDPDDTGLDEESFRDRFGSTGSEAFQQLMARVIARVEALPLYRSP